MKSQVPRWIFFNITSVTSKFQNDVAVLLYGLYHQATIGPCNIPKPRAWSPVELSKWTSWHRLANMAITEAMRLFVKILEEEDPAWYSRVPAFFIVPVVDVEMNVSDIKNPDMKSLTQNGDSLPETKTITTENGMWLETQDKDVVSEGIGSVDVYDQWVAPVVSGQRPKSRYEHGAAVVQDKMYIFGGNHNGRYLNDIQVLNLRSLAWSKVEVKSGTEPLGSSSPTPSAPCAGHSLVPWEDKLLSVAGHTKNPSESVTVKAFDLQTGTWSTLKTYGKASRGSQSVTRVGTSLVMFGGEAAKRTLLRASTVMGVPPSPRSDYVATVHAERYLLIFGGGSHTTCFSDLHVLDMQIVSEIVFFLLFKFLFTNACQDVLKQRILIYFNGRLLQMEWSKPTQKGELSTPRAGHAGVTVGENWFIVGGGDNKSGVSEAIVLNMSTLVWSVLTTVQGRVPMESEGLSIVLSSCNGEDVLVFFGGYNGRYINEYYSQQNGTNVTRGSEYDHEAGEIVMDNADVKETSEQYIATLKSEKEEIEAEIAKQKLESLQLKQELVEAETRNTDITKELQSVRGQLVSEQSRCFKLEVDVAELRQKLQTMETLQKELELLQCQKAASEQAALNAKQRQSSGGVWGWLAGSPQDQKADDA
ncbi:hypothetical protein MKX01_039151 [Papaver californicum]|nr:hypothetical protein MKX01_039151 [Papaver californicum]